MNTNTDTDIKKMFDTIKFYKEFTIEYYTNKPEELYINLGLPILVGLFGWAYNIPFIVYIIRLSLTINIIVFGLVCSTVIVGTLIYDSKDKEEDKEDEPEEEKYEDKYNIDEIEDISGNPSEMVYVSDITPDGIAFMRYNKYKEGFEYWADKSINYEYLETICRKYVKNCRCKNMYIDRKRLLKEKKEKAKEEEKRQEEEKAMEKEDIKKLDDVDDDGFEDVFAKLKTNVDKRYENKKNKKNDNVVEVANKYIYMGKLNEMIPFNVKRNDELSNKTTNQNMTFSMFKKLGF